MASGDGPGVGPIVGAGMVLLVVVGLAMFAMRKGPAPGPSAPAPAATPTPAPTPTVVAPLPPKTEAAGPLRFNDPKNTERYEARRKTLAAIKAAIPDIATKGASVAADVQKLCDGAGADLTMLGAEPNAGVRAFIDGFKRACEYDSVGAALDMLNDRIEAARAKAPAARPADCAVGEPYTKSIAVHHYEDDPAMKDRLGRFAKGCL